MWINFALSKRFYLCHFYFENYLRKYLLAGNILFFAIRTMLLSAHYDCIDKVARLILSLNGCKLLFHL